MSRVDGRRRGEGETKKTFGRRDGDGEGILEGWGAGKAMAAEVELGRNCERRQMTPASGNSEREASRVSTLKAAV